MARIYRTGLRRSYRFGSIGPIYMVRLRAHQRRIRMALGQMTSIITESPKIMNREYKDIPPLTDKIVQP